MDAPDAPPLVVPSTALLLLLHLVMSSLIVLHLAVPLVAPLRVLLVLVVLLSRILAPKEYHHLFALSTHLVWLSLPSAIMKLLTLPPLPLETFIFPFLFFSCAVGSVCPQRWQW